MLQPTDRVLEIGFGPGLPIAELSRRVGDSGHVYGIDHSEVNAPTGDQTQRLRHRRRTGQPGSTEALLTIASQPRCPGATART